MKLELKHLAPYLPYDLQMYYETLKGKKTSWTLRCGTIGEAIVNQNKPILHPLSDLTKGIEVDGEKFVPLGAFYEMYGGGASSKNQFEADYYDNILYTPYKSLSYETVQKLFEWHFDVFGLIENGLAIDINILNK